MIEFWAIKHKPTSFFLPEPIGRMGRGGSHVEPSDPATSRPRLFITEKGAQNALSQWLRGKHYRETYRETDGWASYEVEDSPSIEPAPTRIKTDMEIVKFVAKEII